MALLLPKRVYRRRRKPQGQEDDVHLRLIRQCQCLACGREPAEAAHVRYSDLEAGKPITGIGQKPADRWVNPLCPPCHRNGPGCQHASNERRWWAAKGIDPVSSADRLHELSFGERNKGTPEWEIVEKMRALVRSIRRAAHAVA